jgi:hypothetical protein
MLTEKEYEGICDTHENESLWYFFLNYGCPVRNNSEYKEKYDAVAKALNEYISFLGEQKELLNSDRPLYL